MAKMAEQIPPGYEMFLMTDHVSDSKEASFRCVAFLNQDTKELTLRKISKMYLNAVE